MSNKSLKYPVDVDHMFLLKREKINKLEIDTKNIEHITVDVTDKRFKDGESTGETEGHYKNGH